MGYLKYKNYTGTVEFSEPDKILFGKVMGIRGLISYEGETVEELEKDFKDGIDHYLSVCEEENIKPQKPYTGVFNVRISAETHAKAVLYAIDEGSNLNAFVKSAIEEKLNATETRKRKTGRQTAH